MHPLCARACRRIVDEERVSDSDPALQPINSVDSRVRGTQ